MDTEKINKEILGYGSKLDILIGSDDGEEKIVQYHFTPVALKDIGELTKLLDEFFVVAEKGAWGDKTIDISAKIIKLSIKKMHPEITLDEIKEQFTLAGIGRAISTVMDINDFLSEMEGIKQMGQKVQMASSNQQN